jgi:adenylosuccinate lyase
MAKAAGTIAVGKISGAVGTYAHVDPKVEEHVCHSMGLERDPVSTQIVQRDRHAEYMSTIAVIGSSLEKFATEIRNLQRTDIREAEEYFAKGQKGSSAMPHKRNPITCERIAGLARVLRGNALAALEDVSLWHERDITHSSVERIVVPDSTSLLDYMLRKFTNIILKLNVYPENMMRNLESIGGLIFSQVVLLNLIDKGMLREQAYEIVQSNAMKAWQEGQIFKNLIAQDSGVKSVMTEDEINHCFDYTRHLQRIDEIFARFEL